MVPDLLTLPLPADPRVMGEGHSHPWSSIQTPPLSCFEVHVSLNSRKPVSHILNEYKKSGGLKGGKAWFIHFTRRFFGFQRSHHGICKNIKLCMCFQFNPMIINLTPLESPRQVHLHWPLWGWASPTTAWEPWHQGGGLETEAYTGACHSVQLRLPLGAPWSSGRMRSTLSFWKVLLPVNPHHSVFHLYCFVFSESRSLLRKSPGQRPQHLPVGQRQISWTYPQPHSMPGVSLCTCFV